MSQDPRAKLQALLASGEARIEPLSFSQREIWENSPVPPADPSNHICASIEINGSFPPELCESALRAVVARHEALRTSFLAGKGRVVQLVRSQAEPALALEQAAPADAESGFLGVMAPGFGEPFDMARGPLYRVQLVSAGPDRHALGLTFHHAIADGWSLGVFVSDLCAAYIQALRATGKAVGRFSGARDELPPVEISPNEWAAQERARWTPEELASKAAYWKSRLEGSAQLFASRGPAAGGLDRRVSEISPGLAAAARDLAKGSAATLFSALYAGFLATLAGWTNKRDFVVGTPFANRPKVSTHETFGYFAGVVPLRTVVDPAMAFADFLDAVHASAASDFAGAMPFAELVAALGPAARGTVHPVFDIRFALQNHPVPDIVLPGFSTKLRTLSTGTSRFDLGCEVTETGDSLEVVWLYRSAVVPDSEIRDLDRRLRATLARAFSSPGTSIAKILSSA